MPNASLYLFRYWLINNKDNNEHFLKNQTKNALDFQFEKFSRTLFPPYYDSTSVLNVIDIVDDDLKEKALICTTRREWTAAAAVASFPFHFTSTAPNTAHLFTPSIKDDDDSTHPQQHSSSVVAVFYRKSI